MRHKLPDLPGIVFLSAADGFGKIWAHWGGRGLLKTKVPRTDPYMPYVRMDEDAIYVCKLDKFIDTLDANPLAYLV